MMIRKSYEFGEDDIKLVLIEYIRTIYPDESNMSVDFTISPTYDRYETPTGYTIRAVVGHK